MTESPPNDVLEGKRYLAGELRLSMAAFGHDSEFFLWDREKNEVVPSYHYYPTQEESHLSRPSLKKFKKRYEQRGLSPARVDWYGQPLPPTTIIKVPTAPLSGSSTRIYRDGLAVEVGVSPLRCRAYMWNDTKFTLLKYEPPRMPENIVFTTRPYVKVKKELMEDFPPDLRVLGCSPSRNAYIEDGMVEQEIQVNPMKTMYRTCGSHLHMSFAGRSDKNPIPSLVWARFIALADILIGVPFAYVFGDELEAKRRKLYGRAGEFRFQPSYGGLEYRSLSSRLWDHPASYSFFLGIWKNVLGGGYFSNAVKAYDVTTQSAVQDAINTADPAKAEALLPEVQRLYNAVGVHQVFGLGNGNPFPLKAVLDLFKLKRSEGEIRDCRIWSDPFLQEGHFGFHEYMYSWKLKAFM